VEVPAVHHRAVHLALRNSSELCQSYPELV